MTRSRLVLIVALIATGCGSPDTPAIPTPTQVASIVFVRGVDSFAFTSLRLGESAQLTATARLPDGTTIDCTQTAVWTSSDQRVVRFQAPGLVTAIGPGAVNVRAACLAADGQLPITVRYSMRGTVRQASGQPLANVEVSSIQVNRSTRTDAHGRFELPDVVAPEFDVDVAAPGFETATHHLVWTPEVETTGVELVVRPLGGARILETSGKICAYGPGHWAYPEYYVKYCVPAGAMRTEDRYYFTLPHDGTLRVDTYWYLDYNDFLFIELWCGSSRILKVTQRLGSHGKAFDVPARAGCAYELKLAQESRYAYLAYDLRVTLDP